MKMNRAQKDGKMIGPGPYRATKLVSKLHLKKAECFHALVEHLTFADL